MKTQREYVEYVNSHVSDWFVSIPAKGYKWKMVPAFEIESISPISEWVEWMNREIGYMTRAGYINYYSDLLSEEIIHPVIIIEEHGHYIAIDGNHRMGATALRGGNTIKALLGKVRT